MATHYSPLFLTRAAMAATPVYLEYRNERYHTVLKYPAGWEPKSGELSGGRILDAFVDPSDPERSAV